jgi:hypothetical protein
MSKQYSCEYCKYSSNRLYNLQRHIVSRHINDEPLEKNDTQEYAQKVNLEPQKVNLGSQKVNLGSQKVNPESQKVNLLDCHLKCDRCYKVFTNMWSLNRHEDKCKEIVDANQCPQCLKILSSKQSKYKHMKICKGAKNDIVHVLSTSSTTINCHNTNTTVQNHCMINNGTINNTNNIVINVRNFGEENLDHITNEVKDRLIHQLNGKGIVKLIKDVHFNPNVPENHNVRKYDKSLWEVYDSGDWEIRSYKTTIDDLIKRHKDILYERIADPEFERIVNDPTTLQLIMLNYMNFTMDRVPAHYWKCVRDIYAAFIDFENKQVSEVTKTIV